MPDGSEAIQVRLLDRIAAVDAAEWDACAGEDNPFVSHAFLHALEASGSATAETGWLAQHLAIDDEEGRLAACAPLYVKSHSYGEYVFDHGWADAYERAGGSYYPKLLVAVPFTPVSGPRLLVRPGPGSERFREALVAGLLEAARKFGVSSLHVNFGQQSEIERLTDAGMILRLGLQFHWQNGGYETFDDFLAALSSRKRKDIRKERRRVAEAGIVIEALSGDAIEPRHWDAFYRFYIDTYDRKWGSPYLTREFFDRLGASMAENVVLVLAQKDGVPIAGALNLRGREALYGRNWGCVADYKFLHFEACYYQAIDYAIAHGLARVEAGTQGPHKIQRGYVPKPTYSAHWIRDDGFRRAVADFAERERREVEYEIAAYAGHSPFRKDTADD